MKITKRDGSIEDFNVNKILEVIQKTFLAQYGNTSTTTPAVNSVFNAIIERIESKHMHADTIPLEAIQNYAEEELMRNYPSVAKAFILYRQARALHRKNPMNSQFITLADGSHLRQQDLADQVFRACAGIEHVEPMKIIDKAYSELFNGATHEQVQSALMLVTCPLIETAPEYNFVAARLLMDTIHKEVLGKTNLTLHGQSEAYCDYFAGMLEKGTAAGGYDTRLTDGRFNLASLSIVLSAERDSLFDYIGLKTLYDRYFIHIEGTRIEMPQSFLMRVAMGVSINEVNPTTSAIEFYQMLSRHEFMSSTPTLFNSGCTRAQLSSCFLSTVDDNIQSILATIRDNGLLSKYAGGIGNDWTNVRGLGSRIRGTNGESQGVIPFLKIANDGAVAVNQGGKRKGAICAYLETWHIDVEEFLDLRKNTGDEHRRTPDMNTANWIPDLFMQRVMAEGDWTLFSPNEVPELHNLYGKGFVTAYEGYEAQALAGNIKVFKTVSALGLWRKMIISLFETGHPWITFKDAFNLRSPQSHQGVIHSSNLCTEIGLNTSVTQYDNYGDRTKAGGVAVCNLGSVNLVQHVDAHGNINHKKLQATVTSAVRMLDNVIDLNEYQIPEAQKSNMKHRPIGLGMMGFQDVLYLRNQCFDSELAVQTASETSEAIAYYAYNASADLAQTRGSYDSFEGSDWNCGIVPSDTVNELARNRIPEHAEKLMTTESIKSYMNWDGLRDKVSQGMRNSNVMAIAPTATISNIIGVTPCIEPQYENCFTKSNMSGNFTVINAYMVDKLRSLNMWDAQMIADVKANDGGIQGIERIPKSVRNLFKTAFDIDPLWIIRKGAARQLWIDQAQSLNLYVRGASGKKLDELYKQAWLLGLKSTYYLKTRNATNAEKATGAGGELNAVPKDVIEGAACYLRPGDTGYAECESCQ